jgi:hypothetical protein
MTSILAQSGQARGVVFGTPFQPGPSGSSPDPDRMAVFSITAIHHWLERAL